VSELKYYAPLDDQNCGWMIVYSDQDAPDEIYNDEDCAIKRFKMANQSWNCYLFEIKQYGQQARITELENALDDALTEILRPTISKERYKELLAIAKGEKE